MDFHVKRKTTQKGLTVLPQKSWSILVGHVKCFRFRSEGLPWLFYATRVVVDVETCHGIKIDTEPVYTGLD